MSKTQISCPNCKQPILADIEQLFDVNANPQAKEQLLSGQVNVVNCPQCGYSGSLATPVVYHDASKDYLLTYFPQELNLPMEDQERTIGPLIKKVVDNLPQEERKGYLFKPQQMFTFQTLIEKILEGEGISKEMIEAQKKRMDLLQRLAAVSPESLPELIKQDEDLVDAELFSLFSRLVEGAMGSGDEQSVQQLAALQDALLENSAYGQELKQQSEEIEAVRKTLTDLGEELTREKLLELLEESTENDVRLNALISMTRPALDYEFFQKLTDKIEAAAEPEKEKLTGLRENVLEITTNIDKQLEARLQVAQLNLDALLASESPVELLQQNPGVLDDFFLKVLNQNLQKATQDGNSDQQAKLQSLLDTIQSLLTPGYNPQLLEQLVEAPSDEEREKIIQEHQDEITPEFVESLSGMMMQLQESDNKELEDKVRAAYRATLKASMKKGISGE